MWLLRLSRFLKTAGYDALVLLFACRHPATPLHVKIATLLLAAYVISPVDLLPDLAMLLGWTDDLALLMVGVPFLLRHVPPQARGFAASRVDELLLRRRGDAPGHH